MGMLIGGFLSAVPSGPQVSPNTAGSTNTNTVPSDAYAGVEYNSDGAERGSDKDGNFNVSRGNWLDSGLNSEVWIERTINSGTLDGTDAGAGRLVLSTTRAFSIVRPTVGTDTASVTFDFWDASSGGTKIGTVTLSFSATKEFS